MASEKVSLILELVDRSSKQIKDIDARLSQLDKTTALTDKSVGSLETSMGGLGRAAVGAAAAYLTLNAAMNEGKAIRDVSLQLDAIDQKLQFVAGSSAGAAKQFEFVSSEADRLNQNILTLGQGFSSFAAGAKTLLSLEEIQNVFTGVVEGATAMKLSSEQLDGALLALTQMASKGTVQAEELRGQLAERIPGAFSIAARAMNVTEQELGKLLQTGQVLAKDFLPAFGKEMTKTFAQDAARAADSGIGKINEFNNAVIGLRSTIGDLAAAPASAITEFFTNLVKAADVGIQQLELRIDNIGLAFEKIGTGTLLEFAKSAKASLFEPLADAVGATSENINDLQKEFDGLNAKSAENEAQYKNLQDQWENFGEAVKRVGQTMGPVQESMIRFGDTAESMFDLTKIENWDRNLLKIYDDVEKISNSLRESDKFDLIPDVGNTFDNIAKEIDKGSALGKSYESAIKEATKKGIFDGSSEAWDAVATRGQEINSFAQNVGYVVEGAITDAVIQGIEGDVDPESILKGMGRSLIALGLAFELQIATSVAKGVAEGTAAGVSGLGAVAIGAGLIGLGGVLGGGEKSKKITFDERVDATFSDLISAIKENTQVLELQGLGGTSLSDQIGQATEDVYSAFGGGADFIKNAVASGVITFEDVLDTAGQLGTASGLDAVVDLAEKTDAYNSELQGLGANIVVGAAAFDAYNTTVLENSQAFEQTGLGLSGLSIALGNTALESARVDNALTRLGISTKEEFTELINNAANAGEALADANTTWEDLDSSQQNALISAQNYGNEIDILTDHFGIGANAIKNIGDSVLSLGDIANQQQTFIDKNLGLVETSADSADRLQQRFADEAAVAAQLRAGVAAAGADATPEQLAALAQQEQALLTLGQTTIDSIQTAQASTPEAEQNIQNIISAIDQGQNDLLDVQETLLVQNNDILIEIREAILAQNAIMAEEVATI